jgi:hypothetical protein
VTYQNATIPTTSDIRAEKYRHGVETERDFWFQKAEQLQRELENIYDHATERGFIELHHQNSKLVLYTWDKAAELDAPL